MHTTVKYCTIRLASRILPRHWSLLPLSRRVVQVVASLGLAVLSACGGAGSTQAGLDPQVPGSLAVTISGLPAGAAAVVSVSGPSGFARTLAASETLTGLTPGGYTVTASAVTHDGNG